VDSLLVILLVVLIALALPILILEVRSLANMRKLAEAMEKKVQALEARLESQSVEIAALRSRAENRLPALQQVAVDTVSGLVQMGRKPSAQSIIMLIVRGLASYLMYRRGAKKSPAK